MQAGTLECIGSHIGNGTQQAHFIGAEGDRGLRFLFAGTSNPQRPDEHALNQQRKTRQRFRLVRKFRFRRKLSREHILALVRQLCLCQPAAQSFAGIQMQAQPFIPFPSCGFNYIPAGNRIESDQAGGVIMEQAHHQLIEDDRDNFVTQNGSAQRR